MDPLEVARRLEPVINENRNRYGALCVGLGDDSSQVAALVNSSLGLAEGRFACFSNLEVMRDKHRLRQVLPPGSKLNGLHQMAALDAHPENDLRNIFEKSPHGIVIKPNSGAGSRDVHSIQSEQDLQSLELTPDSYLVEQRFAGPEYSVESISWEGSHQPLVVTEKTTGGTNGLVETGHLQPAQIPDEHRDRLFDAVRTVLDHAGYQTGLSHIEFILEEGQPRLIEAHGRVGGDYIADLMKWSVGASAFEILFRTQQNQRLPESEPVGEHAAVHFPDLRRWSHTDQQWIDLMHENNMVKEAEILKDRDSRGDITCSVERHAYVILAGNKIDDLTQALQNLKVNS
ncbi:ATP-grasp domain-containing protein [Brevibacterium aurantiacum]|uniref:ATP-grasp domain-containing protein n=3 Tax=Brevibacterium TaxID=1696 RepID=A0A4Z0KJG8_BREAU|nr:ATP-grasp domain-containing protein [Brevibacterium aurantiacum]TGD37544.1 ATP-grasp domain-containing protein [Brevibacterium aurantiacum]